MSGVTAVEMIAAEQARQTVTGPPPVATMLDDLKFVMTLLTAQVTEQKLSDEEMVRSIEALIRSGAHVARQIDELLAEMERRS
jgi:hypothetical protein